MILPDGDGTSENPGAEVIFKACEGKVLAIAGPSEHVSSSNLDHLGSSSGPGQTPQRSTDKRVPFFTARYAELYNYCVDLSGVKKRLLAGSRLSIRSEASNRLAPHAPTDALDNRALQAAPTEIGPGPLLQTQLRGCETITCAEL